MKIKEVNIKELKGFKDFKLSFEKEDKVLDLVVLVGSNGTGKTTLLEAIKDFFENKYVNYSEPEKSNVDLKILLNNSEKNSKAIAENKNNGYERHLWEFFNVLSNYKYYQNNHLGIYENLLAKNLENLPKIIYLPTRTNFNNVNTRSNTLPKRNAFINIVDSNVFDDIPSYIATRKNYLANTNDNMTMKEINENLSNEINNIFKILDLDVRFIGLSKDETSTPIFTNSSGIEFDINALSSGEKQLFLRTLSIKMLEPEDSIILIDEPEISLHPKWQQRIIEVYKKIGKNNQIIIATHSPHILGSVDKESVFLLSKDERGNIISKTGDELYDTYGQPTDRILQDIMGLTSVRTPKIEEELNSLRLLIDEDKYETDEFKEKFQRLSKILGETDNDLFLIDMDVKLKQKVKANA
ncbi:MAG: AAA family ATPase [Fusobacterium gastrosuis]|uniref:AAA family ATPase n=1 Tax=Fusobacterium gastrosuis TaxID=1755100 RepID=UPI002A847BBB|nr:AAA family ATPase [Fusobacterium gastrosuis]